MQTGTKQSIDIESQTHTGTKQTAPQTEHTLYLQTENSASRHCSLTEFVGENRKQLLQIISHLCYM